MLRNYPCCHKHTLTPPQPSYLSSLISTTSSWLGFNQSAPSTPPVLPPPAMQAPGPLAPSSTAVMMGAMKEKHSWYYLHPKEALFIGYDAISNFAWSICAQLGVNAKFAKTNNFFHQASAQQLYSLLAVIIASPLGILLTKKIYNEPINISILFTIICGLSSICSVFPWDSFDLLGQKFFEYLGYDAATANYLAVLFPGPGTIAGPLQTVAMTFLSKALDPNFIFSKAEFVAGISPISFLSPNVWKVVFDGMANVAKDSTWGLIGQACLVMLACGIADFATIKMITAIAGYFEKPSTTTTNANRNATAPVPAPVPALGSITPRPNVSIQIHWDRMGTTGSPLYTQTITQHAPQTQYTGIFRTFWRR